jgi:hypothetical protein
MEQDKRACFQVETTLIEVTYDSLSRQKLRHFLLAYGPTLPQLLLPHLSGQQLTAQNFIQLGSHALLVFLVVAVEVGEPKVGDRVQLIVVEDANTVRGTKQTVSNQHLRKILETLFLR